MFLSTVTMALAPTPWERDIAVATGIPEGVLCPAMRRTPNIGSMFTELLSASVNMLRPLVSLVISLPGLIDVWGSRRSCPLTTHGHSILQKCGSDILSLDDFFESIGRANAHYWRSFSMAASWVRKSGENRAANVIDGVAYYGDSTLVPLVGVQSRQVMRTMRIPMGRLTVGLTSSAIGAGSGAPLVANPLRMAHFSYKLVVGSIADIIPLLVRVDRSKGDERDATREILSVMTNRFYDSR